MSKTNAATKAFRCCEISAANLKEGRERALSPKRTFKCGECICSRKISRRVPRINIKGQIYTTAHVILIADGRLPKYHFMHASHLCGNRFCINPAHLHWEFPHMNVWRDLCHKHKFYETCPHWPPCVKMPTREEYERARESKSSGAEGVGLPS